MSAEPFNVQLPLLECFLTSGILRDLQNHHGSALAQLLDALTLARHQRLRTGDVQPLRPPRLPRLGPLASVQSEHTNLTIVTEWVEAGWFTLEPTPNGTCLSIVIAGHSRLTGIQAALSLAECDAWMTAIMDSAWLEYVHRQTEPTKRPDHVKVASYRVFLNEEHSPTLNPNEDDLGKHWSLNSGSGNR